MSTYDLFYLPSFEIKFFTFRYHMGLRSEASVEVNAEVFNRFDLMVPSCAGEIFE